METSTTEIWRAGKSKKRLRYETSDVQIYSTLDKAIHIDFVIGAAGGATRVRVRMKKGDLPLLLNTITEVLQPPN